MEGHRHCQRVSLVDWETVFGHSCEQCVCAPDAALVDAWRAVAEPVRDGRVWLHGGGRQSRGRMAKGSGRVNEQKVYFSIGSGDLVATFGDNYAIAFDLLQLANEV